MDILARRLFMKFMAFSSSKILIVKKPITYKMFNIIIARSVNDNAFIIEDKKRGIIFNIWSGFIVWHFLGTLALRKLNIIKTNRY